MIHLRYAWAMNTEARFWSKVDKSGGPDACWIWTAHRSLGYGVFWASGRLTKAHRHAWALTHGPIPHGLHVLHRCDNPGCVNPNHLFLGTHSDNMADREQKGRGNHARGERHGSRTRPERRPRGERVGTAKLTRAMVREIRALFTTGKHTYRELAVRFGVGYSAVGRAVKEESWKD